MGNEKKKNTKLAKGYIFLFLLLFTFLCLDIWYSYSRVWKGVFLSSNVNRNMLAVDTVWYNPENGYHNDTLVVTILNNKECLFNDNSPYFDYIMTFSKSAASSPDVPEMIDLSSVSINDFTEVGYCLAYVHSTLVNHNLYEGILEGKQDIPKLYINTDGLAEAEKVVFLSDSSGNIYLMSEIIWNDKNR